MKLIKTLVTIAFSILAFSTQAADTSSPTASVGSIQSYTLPNGFKVILVPYQEAPTTKIELLIKTGSKLEGYGETGMAHLLEHMLFKSAGNRKNIKTDLTKLGATWNGTTNPDRTNYFEIVSAEQDKIDEAIKIEADRFMHATFTKEDLQSEMTVVRNELERNDTNPNSLIMRELQRLSYTWHGYSRPTIGARSDIEDAPFENLQAFYKKHYRPDNAAIIISGKFDLDHTLTLVDLLFGAEINPATPKITSWTRDELPPQTRTSEISSTSGKTITASSWKLPGMLDKQTYALDLGINAICDSDWGTLRKDIVLTQKLATSAECSTSLKPDYGLFIASANANKTTEARALSSAITQHIEHAAQLGITSEQLERIRKSEVNSYTRIENTYTDLASVLSMAEVAGDWRLYFWQKELLNTITLDEINQSLKKWIVTLNRNDVILTSVENLNTLDIPKPPAIDTLINEKQWTFTRDISDELPESAIDLATITKTKKVSENFELSYISRKTQGNMAWLDIENDIGNEKSFVGKETACAIASNLIAYGTKDLTRDELDKQMEELNAHWTVSMGNLIIEAPRPNLERALDILLNVWMHAILPEDEFNRIKEGAITNIESTMRDPGSVASNQAQIRFDNYPTNHPYKPLSHAEQLQRYKDVTYKEVQTCAQEFMGRAHIRLAIVGNLTEGEIDNIVTKITAIPTNSIGYERTKNIEAPINVEPSLITVSMPHKPNALISGITYLPITDSDYNFPALRLATKILGGNANSRIWKRLRETDGLAYSSGASLSGNSFEPRTGFSMYASAASKNAELAQQTLKFELSNIINNGITEEELANAKKEWIEERKTSLRIESGFVSMLVNALHTGHDYAWLAEYDTKIANVKLEQVNKALKTYLENAIIVWSIGKGD